VPDVFALDVPAGSLQLVSANGSGNAGNSTTTLGYGVGAPSISADALRCVASRPRDLVAQDSLGYVQVYRRDLQTGTTQLVSLNRDGTAGGKNGNSQSPVISADGTKVLFEGPATDLTGVSTRGVSQLYIRDLAANTMQMVSVDAFGNGGGNGGSQSLDNGYDCARLSPNGRFVAFNSQATDLVPGYVGSSPPVATCTWRDLQHGDHGAGQRQPAPASAAETGRPPAPAAPRRRST